MHLGRKSNGSEILADYSIGLKLKTLRNEKRLTLARLGSETGFSPALLSKLETDRMIPTLPTLAKICHVYGVDLGYFFCGLEHHSLAITRGPHMLEDRREHGMIRTIPLHVLTEQSKQVSQVIEIPAGTTLTMSEHGRRTELTVYVLEGSLGVNSAGAEERLSTGDCIVLDTDAAVLFTASETRCRVLAVAAR